MRHATTLLTLLLTTAPPALCQDLAAPSPAAGSLFLYPERIPLRRRGYAEAERGLLFVPLKRSDPQSRVVAVEIYRFKGATAAARKRPPVFRLHGGPGFTGLAGQLARLGNYERNIEPMTRHFDLVVVGQRGIGSSKPNTLSDEMPKFPLDEEVNEAEVKKAMQAACATGRRYWKSKGYDLTGFNVIEAAADVRDVARALGYGKITLWGGSFGSHWGMAVMRYHPGIVARAVLTGMEGPDHTYDMPGWVLNALERIAKEAEQSGKLQIPEGGLIKAFKAVIARAEREPVTVTIPHPRTGKATTVRFDADDVRNLSMGYTARAGSRYGIRTWPADILKLHAGDFAGAARFRIREHAGRQMITASYFMLDCGSGISPAREARLNADPAAAVVGRLGLWYQICCPAWGSDLGEEFRKGFETEIPTLIVHGNWDVSTPVENARELVPHFKKSKFVVVNGGSHGALSEAMNESAEFRDAVLRFASSGDLSGVPDEVSLSPIKWAVP